jgi:hypothetical protein
MKIMNKYILSILLLFISSQVITAQKVTGVYKGYMEVDSPKNTINFELTLKEKKGKLYGYCYRLFVLRDTLYYNLLKVNARINGDVLIVEDDYSVSNNFENNTRGIKTVFFFNLKDILDTSSVLPGKWNTTAWRNYKSLTGQVTVVREKDYLSTQLYKRLADKNLAQEMSFEDVEDGYSDVAVQDKKDRQTKNPQEKATKRPKDQKNSRTAKNDDRDAKENPANTKSGEKTNSESTTIVNKNSEPVQDKKGDERTSISIQNKQEQTGSENNVSNSDSSFKTIVNEQTINEHNDTLNNENLSNKSKRTDQIIENKTTERAIEVLQTLNVYEDSVTIVLYDNGEIDGDTVSVFIDNKLLTKKIGLSAKAQKIKIFVPVGQEVQVSLYAETLGSIPPNTGLMLVNSGGQYYQVFFTSTLEKSASVLFRRQ